MNIKGIVVRRGAAVAVAAAAMTAALGACSTGQTAPQPQGSGGAGAAPVAQQADAAKQGMAANSAPDGGGVANAGNKIPCANLRVTLSQPAPVNDNSLQWRFPVMMTNRSDATCAVRGFPKVVLNGVDGTSWELTNTNAPATPVVLRPGEHADANLTYLVEDSTDGWKVSSITVTPPGTTDTQSVTWAPGVSILKQDAATHPGTYIDPVVPSPAK